MDPVLLRTFVTVARLRSFSGAAGALGYTQSAVSQQIAALERELGVPLLSRRPVAPTEAGERLLEHAEPILLRIDAARTDLSRLVGTPLLRLSLALSPLAAPERVARALDGTRRTLPRLTTTVRVLPREAVLEAVATGRAEAGLMDGLAAPSDPLALPARTPLTATAVAEEPLAVLLPTGHPLSRRAAIDLASLADAHWLDAPDTAIPLADLRATLGTDAFPATLRCEGTDPATVAALVATGHGLALLPRSAARRLAAAYGVVAVVLRSPRVVHRTELVRLGAPLPAVAAFLDAITAAERSAD